MCCIRLLIWFPKRQQSQEEREGHDCEAYEQAESPLLTCQTVVLVAVEEIVQQKDNQKLKSHD